MGFLGPSLRRKKVSDRPGARTGAAVALSVAVNLVILLLLARGGAFMPPKQVQPTAVALAPLTADKWAANRAIQGGSPPPAAGARPPPALAIVPPPPPPPAPKRENGQVVDIAPSKNQAPPKDARFLAEHDSSTDRETRSRFAGTEKWENVLPSPSTGPKGKAPQPAPGEAGVAQKSSPGKEGPKAGGTGATRVEVPRQAQQEKLALAPPRPGDEPGDVKVAPRDDKPRVPGTSDALAVPGTPKGQPPSPGAPGQPGQSGDAEGGQRSSGQLSANLLPDKASMYRIAGGPSLDRLRGMDEEDATSLNARSFKFATFYNQMKRAIGSVWNPNRAYTSRDPDGRMFANRDRTTWTEFVLQPDGALKAARVVQPSGLEFLDDEAVRAIKAAAPFPNPPAGLVENGEIRIVFSFTVEAAHAVRVNVMNPGNLPGWALPGQSGQQPFPQH